VEWKGQIKELSESYTWSHEHVSRSEKTQPIASGLVGAKRYCPVEKMLRGAKQVDAALCQFCQK